MVHNFVVHKVVYQSWLKGKTYAPASVGAFFSSTN